MHLRLFATRINVDDRMRVDCWPCPSWRRRTKELAEARWWLSICFRSGSMSPEGTETSTIRTNETTVHVLHQPSTCHRIIIIQGMRQNKRGCFSTQTGESGNEIQGDFPKQSNCKQHIVGYHARASVCWWKWGARRNKCCCRGIVLSNCVALGPLDVTMSLETGARGKCGGWRSELT